MKSGKRRDIFRCAKSWKLLWHVLPHFMVKEIGGREASRQGSRREEKPTSAASQRVRWAFRKDSTREARKGFATYGV